GAGRGGSDGPRPSDQPHWVRRPRGADAGDDRLHPGPRRAALPIAEGDHGRPVEGADDEIARGRRWGGGLAVDDRGGRGDGSAPPGGDPGHPRSRRRGRPAGRRVPRRAEDRLMAAAAPIWVHGEIAPDGSLAKVSTEVATL